MMAQEVSVGDRLRKLRNERSLSQRALAELAGVSANSISLIERKEISPSVATLTNLATALKVRISYFFEEDSEQSVLHVKADQRSSMDSQGVHILGIGSRIRSQEVEPFIMRLAPQTGSGKHPVIHAGHEVVYCMKGKLEYVIDGNRYLMEEGDFLLFEARLPHRWHNPFTSEAEFFLVLQTPDATLDPVKHHFVEYPSVSHID